MELVFKKLLDVERHDPSLELACILSLTTNKLSIYSKVTNVFVLLFIYCTFDSGINYGVFC